MRSEPRKPGELRGESAVQRKPTGVQPAGKGDRGRKLGRRQLAEEETGLEGNDNGVEFNQIFCVKWFRIVKEKNRLISAQGQQHYSTGEHEERYCLSLLDPLSI